MTLRMASLARMLEAFEPQPHPSNVHPGGMNRETGEFVPGTPYTEALVAGVNRRMSDPRTAKEGAAMLEYPEETRARIELLGEMTRAFNIARFLAPIKIALFLAEVRKRR